MNTEKEFEYTLMKFKRKNEESNGQFNYKFLFDGGRVSVGLFTIDVSSIAIGKLVNGRWRIIWGI